ncbi:MAG: manganese efflux pump, partial [Treponema sp.]|nr:manganese efflux pump [Treponema sp.]
MSVLEVFLIGVALSMDAFAVSISNGLIIRHVTFRKAVVIALTYGVYQFLMPVIGYVGASFFYRFIRFIDHWIAFSLLGFLGGKMILDSIREMKAEKKAPCQQEGAAEKKLTGQDVPTGVSATECASASASAAASAAVAGTAAASAVTCAASAATCASAADRKIAFLPFKTLMVQGIATSIDALAVGISFAAISVQGPTYIETLL